MPIPVFDRNKGNILTAQGFLIRATEEIPRVQNDLRSRLADAFERFETNRFQVGVSRDQILPDAVRTYRGTYERHAQESEVVGFADVVVAQQNLLSAVGTYITALNGQWAAFVDIAGLLQVESLKELSLKLRDEPAGPSAAENPNLDGDVSSMMAELQVRPKSATPVAASDEVSGSQKPRQKRIRQADIPIPDEDSTIDEPAEE
jgi:cobalt-zinc-cadmium efflux system outer membrane protein